MVTVQPAWVRRKLVGLPTMSEAPTTQTSRPVSGMPVARMSTMTSREHRSGAGSIDSGETTAADILGSDQAEKTSRETASSRKLLRPIWNYQTFQWEIDMHAAQSMVKNNGTDSWETLQRPTWIEIGTNLGDSLSFEFSNRSLISYRY